MDEYYYSVWLETDYDWCPSIIPIDFANTKLFEFGHQWIGVSYKPINKFYGPPWLDKYTESRYKKAYCHCSISYILTGDVEDDKEPYMLTISGGDDISVYKTYTNKQDAELELDKLSKSVITYELVKQLGFRND